MASIRLEQGLAEIREHAREIDARHTEELLN
jgi:hypothetical protein